MPQPKSTPAHAPTPAKSFTHQPHDGHEQRPQKHWQNSVGHVGHDETGTNHAGIQTLWRGNTACEHPRAEKGTYPLPSGHFPAGQRRRSQRIAHTCVSGTARTRLIRLIFEGSQIRGLHIKSVPVTNPPHGLLTHQDLMLVLYIQFSSHPTSPHSHSSSSLLFKTSSLSRGKALGR